MSRRLAALTAALSIAHFAVALALVAGFSAEIPVANLGARVFAQPARSVLALLPGVPPFVQWLVFAANSLLWGFCIALLLVRWVSNRAAFVGVTFLLSGVLTLVGMRIIFTDAEWLGLAMAPLWAATIFSGAYFFPGAMGEVGTPVTHLLGIVLNALFLTTILLTSIRITKRMRASGRSNGT